jgi:hypothetical protein
MNYAKRKKLSQYCYQLQHPKIHRYLGKGSYMVREANMHKSCQHIEFLSKSGP